MGLKLRLAHYICYTGNTLLPKVVVGMVTTVDWGFYRFARGSRIPRVTPPVHRDTIAMELIVLFVVTALRAAIRG
jgi:hypothetical protein